jgi:D-tyrosyl-tRNA(Tyr) deacylase
MRAVVQRVSSARVLVDGSVVGANTRGLLVRVGVGPDDGAEDVAYIAGKVRELRVFPDDAGKMNRSVADAGGAVLLVSQFTLYGDASKGRRPSFIDAAQPNLAIPLYEKFVAVLKEKGGGKIPIETGEFGAMMDVELVNDGPVTLLLER